MTKITPPRVLSGGGCDVETAAEQDILKLQGTPAKLSIDTVKEAVRLDNGHSIYRHFGFEPSKKAQKENPFRNERTSSFYIRPNGYFKDFGDDNKGDAFNFIQQYCNVDFKGAVQIVASIYGITDTKEAVKYYRSTTHKPTKTRSKPVEPNKYKKLRFRNHFTDKEKRYWKDKTHANIETVARYFKPVIGDKMRFAVEILKDKQYKLIQPENTPKTIWNGQGLDYLRSNKGLPIDYAFSIGIDDLEPNKQAILCEGEKDFIALKDKGYNVFTLGNAVSSIPDFIQLQLGAKGIGLSDVFILFDTDDTGIKNSLKLAEKHGCKVLSLPKLIKGGKPKYNDVCDYLQLYGFDDDLKSILELPDYRNIHLQGCEFADVPVFKIPKGKYLSDVIAVAKGNIDSKRIIQIQSDPSNGKSVASLVTVPELYPDYDILFVTNNKDQVDQLYNEVMNEEHFSAVRDKICFYTDKGVKTIKGKVEDAKVHVAYLDKAKFAYNCIKEKNEKVFLIVDESHTRTTDYFRTLPIKQNTEIRDKADKVLLLSATPDYFDISAKTKPIPLVIFEREENPQIDVSILEYSNNTLDAAYNTILKALDKANGNKVVVRLLSKNMVKNLSKMLIKNEILSEYSIDTYFADKKNTAKQTRTKESIKKKGLIPDDIRLLFVTNVFDIGINVKNEDIGVVINFHTKPEDNCLFVGKQYPQRFRKLKDIDYWICMPKKELDAYSFDDKVKYFDALNNTALNKMELYKIEGQHDALKRNINYLERYGLKGFKKHGYLKHNTDINPDCLLLTFDENNKLVPNTDYIKNAVYLSQCRKLDKETYKQELLKSTPNSKIVFEGCIKELNKATSDELKNIKKEITKEQREFEGKVIDAIEEERDLFLNSVSKEFSDSALSRSIEGIIKADLPYNSTDTLIGADTKGYDETILTQAKRYTQLNDFYLEHPDICSILKNNTDGRKFSSIHKGLTNHFSIFMKEELGDDFFFFAGDKIFDEQAEKLLKLRDGLKDKKGQDIKGVRSDSYRDRVKAIKNKIEDINTEIAELKNEKPKLKRDKQRNVSKIKTREKRLESYKIKFAEVEKRYNGSIIKNAIEVKDSRELRLFESLFKIRKKTKGGKLYVSIEGDLKLEDYLKKIGVKEPSKVIDKLQADIKDFYKAKADEEKAISGPKQKTAKKNGQILNSSIYNNTIANKNYPVFSGTLFTPTGQLPTDYYKSNAHTPF